MKIEVFGVGCAKCVSLEMSVREAVKQMNVQAEVVKVTDINEMVEKGIMSTPALAIDGKVVAAGKTLTVQDVVALINKARVKG
ncbi:MAG: thioredoxin family protein [Methanobacteriota archaeon]